MLRLKNIKINNRFAEADFYPEDIENPGHIVVDLESEEILSIRNVPGYEYMYPGHARKKLVQMANEGNASAECIVVWY